MCRASINIQKSSEVIEFAGQLLVLGRQYLFRNSVATSDVVAARNSKGLALRPCVSKATYPIPIVYHLTPMSVLDVLKQSGALSSLLTDFIQPPHYFLKLYDLL